MAHELRNPLASLKGHAQLLAEDLEGDPKKKAKVDRVVNEAERLEVLTTSLLEFVREGPIERASTAPDALLDRALSDLDRTRVKVDATHAPKDLSLDPLRLSRAVHNLVENALQAKPDGEVALTIDERRKDATVEVRDQTAQASPPTRRSSNPSSRRARGNGPGPRSGTTDRGAARWYPHRRESPDGGAAFRLRFPQ